MVLEMNQSAPPRRSLHILLHLLPPCHGHDVSMPSPLDSRSMFCRLLSIHSPGLPCRSLLPRERRAGGTRGGPAEPMRPLALKLRQSRRPGCTRCAIRKVYSRAGGRGRHSRGHGVTIRSDPPSKVDRHRA
eukprot:4400833-Prymnesium_polylepis.1